MATCRSKYTGVKKTKQTKACDHVELRGEFLSVTIESSGDKFVGQVRDHAERVQMKLSNLEDIKSEWEKETMNSTLRASSSSFRIFAVRASFSSAESLKSLSVDVNRSSRATSTCSWHTQRERERECESEKLIERKKRSRARERQIERD